MDKIKKLKLKKEVIANLSNAEMGQIKGGGGTTTLYDCFTEVHCSGGCDGGGGGGGNGGATSACGGEVRTRYCGGIDNSKTCPPTASISCLPTDPYW